MKFYAEPIFEFPDGKSVLVRTNPIDAENYIEACLLTWQKIMLPLEWSRWKVSERRWEIHDTDINITGKEIIEILQNESFSNPFWNCTNSSSSGNYY